MFTLSDSFTDCLPDSRGTVSGLVRFMTRYLKFLYESKTSRARHHRPVCSTALAPPCIRMFYNAANDDNHNMEGTMKKIALVLGLALFLLAPVAYADTYDGKIGIDRLADYDGGIGVASSPSPFSRDLPGIPAPFRRSAWSAMSS